MRRSALACLPAAILAAFIGVIATPAESRASASSGTPNRDEISLQRPDERQFEVAGSGPTGSTSARADLNLAARRPSGPVLEPIALETGCTTPYPTVDVEPSPGDADAMNRVLDILEVGMKVWFLIMFIRIFHAFGDFLHSETPAAQGAAR